MTQSTPNQVTPMVDRQDLINQIQALSDKWFETDNGDGFGRADPGEIEYIADFIRDLLASAVTRERERIAKILNPGLKDLLPVLDVTDKWWRLHQEMGGEVVWQDMAVDDDMSRQRPVRVIYKSPIFLFQEASGLTQPDTIIK